MLQCTVSDSYESWENVVVQASVKITLRSFEAAIKRVSGYILLSSSTHCSVTSRTCLYSEGAETFWQPPLPVDSCHFDQYNIIYEGLATKLTKANGTTTVIYTLTTQETIFALTKTTEFNLCGYQLTQTEHLKFFILKTEGGCTFRTRSKISTLTYFHM